jgi:hypothetical protein
VTASKYTPEYELDAVGVVEPDRGLEPGIPDHVGEQE